MISDSSEPESERVDEQLVSKKLLTSAPLGDFYQDEAAHMSDWWRDFSDGRYDKLQTNQHHPATLDRI